VNYNVIQNYAEFFSALSAEDKELILISILGKGSLRRAGDREDTTTAEKRGHWLTSNSTRIAREVKDQTMKAASC